jgi:hypothetical protein
MDEAAAQNGDILCDINFPRNVIVDDSGKMAVVDLDIAPSWLYWARVGLTENVHLLTPFHRLYGNLRMVKLVALMEKVRASADDEAIHELTDHIIKSVITA